MYLPLVVPLIFLIAFLVIGMAAVTIGMILDVQVMLLFGFSCEVIGIGFVIVYFVNRKKLRSLYP